MLAANFVSNRTASTSLTSTSSIIPETSPLGAVAGRSCTHTSPMHHRFGGFWEGGNPASIYVSIGYASSAPCRLRLRRCFKMRRFRPLKAPNQLPKPPPSLSLRPRAGLREGRKVGPSQWVSNFPGSITATSPVRCVAGRRDRRIRKPPTRLRQICCLRQTSPHTSPMHHRTALFVAATTVPG